MNISITVRHCELDPEVRLFIHERLERLLRYFRDPNDLMEAHVVIAAEKYRHSAEITLKLRRGEVVSHEQADEPRAAIDLAADRLEHQILRLKEKRLARVRAGSARDQVPPPPLEASDEDAREEFFDEPAEPYRDAGAPGRSSMED